jgi:hypothetical protein
MAKKIITNRFVGKDGEFVPSEQPPEGTVTLQYLEELMEWVFYHDNYTYEEKLEHLTNLEAMAKEHVGKIIKNCNYISTWSPKLKK